MRILLLGILFCFAVFALDQEDPRETKENCNVRIRYQHEVSGSRCLFYDEVMVGISSLDPLRIRCGILEVDCNKKVDNLRETEHQENN